MNDIMGGTLSSLYALLWRGRGGGKDEAYLDPYMLFEENVKQAVKTGNLSMLRELQEESVQMLWGGIETVSSTPPLVHLAAARGDSDILKFLLDQGANVEDTDTCGMTVLHETCRLRQPGLACFQAVVGRVRDIDRRDIWRRTPLIKALVYRNVDSAMTLLHMGANPNAADVYGITPLSTAVNYDLMDMVQALILHGADINFMSQQCHRYTSPPLYLAINNQNVAMATELLRLGACTQPNPQAYLRREGIGPISWQYLPAFAASTSNPPAPLQHSNAVALAISELLKRGSDREGDRAMELLQSVLSAHGHVLGPASDVLVRVLLNSRQEDFSLLLHKFLVCSGSCQDDLLLSYNDRASNLRHSERPQHLQQLDHHLNNNNNDNDNTLPSQRRQRPVTSLETQARRMVRQSVMRSGRNVVWATRRLHCPPRLKSLILLRDIDQAHGVASTKLIDDL